MDAYEVFYAQTQSTINFLYILVMCLLPMLWFGDCKKAMSLLFKKIQIPSHEENVITFEFTQNLQIIVILLGIGAYKWHRRWRLGLQEKRCNMLRDEASFTDTIELRDLRIKLLDKIDKIVEEKISLPLKCYTSGVKPERTLYSFKSSLNPHHMKNITEDQREGENSSDLDKAFGKEKKKPGCLKRTPKRRFVSSRKRLQL